MEMNDYIRKKREELCLFEQYLGAFTSQIQSHIQEQGKEQIKQLKEETELFRVGIQMRDAQYDESIAKLESNLKNGDVQEVQRLLELLL